MGTMNWVSLVVLTCVGCFEPYFRQYPYRDNQIPDHELKNCQLGFDIFVQVSHFERFSQFIKTLKQIYFTRFYLIFLIVIPLAITLQEIIWSLYRITIYDEVLGSVFYTLSGYFFLCYRFQVV